MKADPNKKQAPQHTCPRCGRDQLVRVGKINPGKVNLYECFFCGQREATEKEKHRPYVQNWLDGQKLRLLE